MTTGLGVPKVCMFVKFFTLTHSSTDPGVLNFLSRQTERQRSQAFQAARRKASKQRQPDGKLILGLEKRLDLWYNYYSKERDKSATSRRKEQTMKHTIYSANTRQVAFEGSAYECWKWLTSQLADGCYYKTWEADGERYCDVGSVYIIR